MGISLLKKEGGRRILQKLFAKKRANSVYRNMQAFCMLAKGVHSWVEVELWGWWCSKEGRKVMGESSHV